MRVFRKILAVLIGLAMIAVIGLRIYYKYDLDIIYHASFPDTVNLVLVYVFLGLKALAVFFIMIGGKKSARLAIIPLALVIAEVIYLAWPMLEAVFELFKLSGFDGVFSVLGVEGTLVVGSLLAMALFGFLYLLIALFGGTRFVASKIFLFIFALLPLGLTYTVMVMNKVYYPANLQEIIMFVDSVGVYFILGLLIAISHMEPY